MDKKIKILERIEKVEKFRIKMNEKFLQVFSKIILGACTGACICQIVKVIF